MPPSGLIPANWESLGPFTEAHQMLPGEVLLYRPTSRPLDPASGHVFQYVADRVPGGWSDVGRLEGAPGVTGPMGPRGPAGAGGIAVVTLDGGAPDTATWDEVLVQP